MQQPDNPDRRKLLKTAAAVSAAAALTACGQGGQSAQTVSSPEGKAAADCSGNGSHSQTSYDCYGVHQAGITTPHQTFGILCAFDVTVSDISQLINYFRTLTARIEFLTKGGELVDGDDKLPPAGSGLLGKTVPPDGLTVTVSVGASLFDARFGLGGKKPKHLQEMKDFPNDKLQKEWCDGDIGIQICAFSPETCQNALRDIIKNTAKYAITRWSLDGWLPKAEPGAIASRNLFGFRDGTANPDVSKPEIADQVLWTGVASNSLDERTITSIIAQGGCVDSYGVGERLITAYSDAKFGAVYKLAAIKQGDTFVPKIKLSENVGKITNPGRKRLFRVYSDKGHSIADLITCDTETVTDGSPFEYLSPEKPWAVRTFEHCTFRELLQPLFRDGKQVAELPALKDIRAYVRRQLDEEVWKEEQRFENPHIHYLDMSVKYYQMKMDLMKNHE